MRDGDEPRVAFGRAQELATLASLLDRGEAVVLHGRVGVGKSTLLRALARRARLRGRPCAVLLRTDTLGDFTSTFARAYPSVPAHGSPRQIRGRLLMAVEQRPGVLLFDHLGATGSAFKGAIKAVRGSGLGILLAVDADEQRDREGVRALGLSHHEIELRPLHGRSIRALLLALLEQRAVVHPLTASDLRALATATEGLPGRAVEFADALADPDSWSGGRPRVDWLRTGAAIRAAERYRARLGEGR